jgi:predicted anti-sigma-YlaC factor YlaD
MDCNAYREAISARIDGEDHGLEPRALDAHLATCGGCRSWADTAVVVTRAARVAVADAVPDLTEPILAAAQARQGRARVPGRAGMRPAGWASAPSPTAVARLGLLMVAAAQTTLAVPALLGNDPGASIHIAHEQGSWALALAVGFLLVALRPRRAVALLPVVAALVAGLAATMAIDIAAGRTQAAAEAPHGLAFLGLGLLWLLSRQVHGVEVARLARPSRTATAA